MTLTRWKLMAGCLGLSIVGVVAVANPQCPNTKKDAAREVSPPARVVAAKAVEVVPDFPQVVTTPVLPSPAVSPSLPAPYEPPPAFKVDLVPLKEPAAKPVLLAVETPSLPKLDTPTPLPAPKPEPTVLSDLPSIKGVTLPNTVPDVGVPKVAQVVELPLPGVVAAKPVAPVPDLPMPVEVRPAPIPTVEVKPIPLPTPTVEPKLAPEPRPDLRQFSAAPTKVEATPVKRSNTSEEAAVRVMIHLGTGQPKFDVLAGDDVLLKAVCDNVDIRSPSEKGAGVTPLKAGGKVRFSAPGCEGTCDNLTVLPSSGEVELAGNVKVHCRMGKGETEINAATMKFKLGSAPAYAVPEPAVTPASVR